MNFFSLQPNIVEMIGVAGFCLYVLNYTMLTTRVLSGDCLLYFSINFTAAFLVLIGLSENFNLAAALIQAFFMCMSTLGIAIRIMRPGGSPS